jgi:hypothetical protein
MMKVEFAIHGAVCKQCTASVVIHLHCKQAHELLENFIKKHHTHEGFTYSCKITDPFGSDMLMEIAIK